MKLPIVARLAVHEAGHSLVLAPFGARTSARIWLDGGEWHGVTHIEGIDGTSGLPPNWRRIYGCAGLVAEFLLIRPDADEQLTFAWLGLKQPSETDARHMENLTMADVLDCLMLLRYSWPQVLEVADQLCAQEHGSAVPS